MNHEEIRHKLSEYIDGAITAGERAEIEQHLKTCTECTDALHELKKTIDHIREIEEVESPAWMTQKIMAKVREEKEAKNSLWQRYFAPIFKTLPVQAVAVLFLSVTVFYIYTTMHPSEKYAEAPKEQFAKQEAHDTSRNAHKHKAPENTEHRENKVAQEPDYKSLDMKYEYEKPAPPVPQDRTVASAPAPAKGESQMYARDKADREKRAAAPRAVAPSMMAEQAAPSAGAVQPTEDKRATASEAPKAKKAIATDKEADVQLDITEHFVKVDLPWKMKVKGLTYRTRKFEKDIEDLRWMLDTNAYRSKQCTERYVVDVDLSGKLSKYLYCYDRAHIILLGVFELKNGTWSAMN
jgi:hypothetical protein